VKPEDARELAGRRWDLVERLDAEHWAREKRRLTPLEALGIAEGLRAHVARLRSDWPSAHERAEDLVTHERVTRKLACVARLSRR
jgi:hypothetical protein